MSPCLYCSQHQKGTGTKTIIRKCKKLKQRSKPFTYGTQNRIKIRHVVHFRCFLINQDPSNMALNFVKVCLGVFQALEIVCLVTMRIINLRSLN